MRHPSNWFVVCVVCGCTCVCVVRGYGCGRGFDPSYLGITVAFALRVRVWEVSTSVVFTNVATELNFKILIKTHMAAAEPVPYHEESKEGVEARDEEEESCAHELRRAAIAKCLDPCERVAVDPCRPTFVVLTLSILSLGQARLLVVSSHSAARVACVAALIATPTAATLSLSLAL